MHLRFGMSSSSAVFLRSKASLVWCGAKVDSVRGMSSRGGGGRGRGNYYKEKYGGGGHGRGGRGGQSLTWPASQNLHCNEAVLKQN